VCYAFGMAESRAFLAEKFARLRPHLN